MVEGGRLGQRPAARIDADDYPSTPTRPSSTIKIRHRLRQGQSNAVVVLRSLALFPCMKVGLSLIGPRPSFHDGVPKVGKVQLLAKVWPVQGEAHVGWPVGAKGDDVDEQPLLDVCWSATASGRRFEHAVGGAIRSEGLNGLERFLALPFDRFQVVIVGGKSRIFDDGHGGEQTCMMLVQQVRVRIERVVSERRDRCASHPGIGAAGSSPSLNRTRFRARGCDEPGQSGHRFRRSELDGAVEYPRTASRSPPTRRGRQLDRPSTQATDRIGMRPGVGGCAQRASSPVHEGTDRGCCHQGSDT